MPTSAAPLPPLARETLDRLGRRGKQSRLLYRLAFLFFAFSLILALAFLLDWWLGLTTIALRIGLGGLLGVAAVLGIWGLPWWKGPRPEILAAALEEKYPELQERFTALLHLSPERGEGHGSPALIEALGVQAEEACPRLDLDRVQPLGPAWNLVALGLAFLSLQFAPALFSSEYRSFLDRFLGAFRAEEVQDGENHRIMTGDRQGKGEGFSPVAELYVPEGTLRARVGPPPYLPAEPQEVSAAEPIEAKQFGSLEMSFALNRAPTRVKVLWQEAAGKEVSLPELTALKSEGEEFRGRWLLPETGKFTGALLLEAEHGVSFRQRLVELEVMPDEAPRVRLSLAKTGGPEGYVVIPGDIVPFQVEASDREGLGELAWEYRLGEGEVHEQGKKDLEGSPSFDEEVAFQVPATAKIGERLELRLRVRDRREVKKGSLGRWDGKAVPGGDVVPHTVYEPKGLGGKGGWLSFRIQKAGPWRLRVVVARRDETDGRLKGLVKKVEGLRGDVEKLRTGSHRQPRLRPEQEKRLEKLKEINQDLRLEMLFLAQKVGEEGYLDLLAQRLENLAEEEMKRSQEALELAGKPSEGERDAAFHRAETQLLKAVGKLNDFFKLNEALAKGRLDRLELGDLAVEEDDLAAKTATAARNEKADREEELREKQERIREKFEELIRSSPFLKGLMQDADSAKAEETAKKLEDLARSAREPEDPLGGDRETKDLLEELTRKQAELADRVDAWQKGMERVEQARGAARALELRYLKQALTLQQEAEEGLGRVADLLENGGKPGPRERMLRLARIQEALNRDHQRFAKDLPRLNPEEKQAAIEKMVKAQKELVRELEALKVPEKTSTAQARALDLLKEIPERLEKDSLGAFFKMEEGMALLHGMAGMLPVRDEGGSPAAAVLEKAKAGRSLQGEQRTLRLQLEKLVAGVEQRAAKAGEERSAALKEKAGQLAQDLMKLSQSAGESKAKGMMEQAAKLAGEAKMGLEGKGKSSEKSAVEMEKEAGLKLDMAAKLAREAMEEMKAGRPKEEAAMGDPEASKDFEKSKRSIAEASMDLKKGDLDRAARAMNEAAKAMKRVATEAKAGKRGKALSRVPGKSPAPVGPGPAAGGKIPEKDLEKFLGIPWGELPGEVQARVILDLQQRFGPEYQPIIQRYFENLSRGKR